jgi:RNA polymerase sigma-70 factor (ECF subfamily)
MSVEDRIAELKAGDSGAFRQLVEEFKDRVYNTVLGVLQNKEEAQDVTQEVFTEVYQSIARFKGDAKLSTWIYRIALSKAYDVVRRKNRKKRFAFVQSLFGEEGDMIEAEQGEFAHPGVQLENKERAAILFGAIEKLAENQKTAFLLNKLEGLSYAEIAEIMNVTVPAVESLLFRAKQNLQKRLREYFEENEK